MKFAACMPAPSKRPSASTTATESAASDLLVWLFIAEVLGKLESLFIVLSVAIGRAVKRRGKCQNAIGLEMAA